MARPRGGVRVPALGASAAGAPAGAGGRGGLPAGVGAPPVSAAAGVGKACEEHRRQGANPIPAGRCPAPVLLRATCPLFRSPAELAVGLALKEMRYGPVRPIRPWDLQGSLRFLRSRPVGPGGIRHCWRGSIDTRQRRYRRCALGRAIIPGRWASARLLRDEDLCRHTRRPPARLVCRRCRGPDPGPAGDPDRRRPARQAQARVHPARRHRRLRRRRQRREDPRHRQQAGSRSATGATAATRAGSSPAPWPRCSTAAPRR